MRSMTSPKVTPETTPPPGKSAVSTTDAEIERPASCKTVGNQLERKKISRRLQKKIIQIRIVPRARPSRKRCFTVIPAACSSCITKVVPSAKTVDGLMRRSTAVIFAGAYFFSTRWRRDSGSFAATTTANMSGRIPPATNTEGHPNSEIKPAAKNPPDIAPTVKPDHIAIVVKVRLREGKYSEVNAIALGIEPPSPSPGRKRRTLRDCSESAQAVRRDITPKKIKRPSRTRLRPTQSPSGAMARHPTNRPVRPIANTDVNSYGGTLNCRITAGAT